MHVKQVLEHQQLKNTETYTHLVGFECDEFHVAHADNIEEESKLIEAGFQFVRNSERDEMAIYRRRK